ncbi:hypothetical protein GIB67_010009 [Kingdonia uniflora]|uniref:Uncharacterized protein n=1 Tax=Kingdonia uniflora TaxID=39325 RepID=A0A7J7LBD5_9MAGN|nr:hypothetical protein GIB67_010009 [Kingdonia uniflora]
MHHQNLTSEELFAPDDDEDDDDKNESEDNMISPQNLAHEASIVKVVWVPPDTEMRLRVFFGDGTVSIWEEVVEGITSFQLVVLFSIGLAQLEINNWKTYNILNGRWRENVGRLLWSKDLCK